VSVESTSGVTKVSVITKPTLAVTFVEVLLKINVCLAHLTKLPRTKYTPSSTVTAEPLFDALEENVVRDAVPAVYVVVCVIETSALIFSPSAKKSLLSHHLFEYIVHTNMVV
jgi:hypothetical protein